MCLQNVETELYQNMLKPELAKLGYEGELKSFSKTTKIGVATFYHTRTFRLLKVRQSCPHALKRCRGVRLLLFLQTHCHLLVHT